MVARAARPRDVLAAVAVSALAGAVFVAHGFEGVLTRDLAIYVYAGQRVAEGAPPYVELVNRSGPLSHLAPGLAIAVGRLVGMDDVIAARAAFLLVSVAAVLVAYRTAHRVLGSAALAAGTATVLVMITGFVQYASRGPREKTLMVLFVLLALDGIVRGRWLRTGVYISLATLTWQPAFFPPMAAALVMLALQREGRRRGLTRLVLGGLAPLAVFAVWYAAVGHLRDFLDNFVLIHYRHTDQPGLLDDLQATMEATIELYGWSFWVMLLGLLAILAAGTWSGVRVARAWRERTDLDTLLVALAAGTLAGLLWSVRAFNGWADLFFLFPFTLAGVAVVLSVLSRAVAAAWSTRSSGSRSRLPAVQRVVGVAASVGALAAGAQFVATHESDALVGQRTRAEAVLAALGPDATVQSIQAPAPLVLTRTTNPTRHQMFSLGLQSYVDEVWPEGLDGFAQDVLRERPTLLTVESGADADWVQEVLGSAYVRAGVDRDGGYEFYVLDDLDPAVLGRVREAAASGQLQ